MPPAQYTMSKDEKDVFLSVLKGGKVPDGYYLNIAKRVNMKERTLQRLKSHDNHILIQQLLPISIQNCLPKNVVASLIEVSNFFRQLCSRVHRIDELNGLQEMIAVTLCQLEKKFPPAFFDVMVHLTIHLTGEALLGGPVQFKWAYPIKRYMNTLKSSEGRSPGSVDSACPVLDEQGGKERGSYECVEPRNAGSRTQVGDLTHHPGPPRAACQGKSGRQDVRLDAFSRSSPPEGCSYLRPVSVKPGDVAREGAQFAIMEG
ncbi:hypothetical protein AAC387_Pa11g1236 [Persea americana]